MGHSIALSFAGHGRSVRVFEPDASTRAGLLARVASSLTALGRDQDAIDSTVARIEVVADLADAVADADYVTEAAPEKVELKQQLFAELETVVPDDAVLASNTSVIPITLITAGRETGHRMVGTHWWNPGHLIPLVEVVRTATTSEQTVVHTMRTLEAIGKTPVRVEKDIPGFIGNRLQHALWREAISLVEKGVCSAEDVDLVITSSFGRRLAVLGPLANADLIGTPLTLDIHEQVLHDLESRPEPSPLLRQLVADGRTGFASGEGFRHWTDESIAAVRAAVNDHLIMLASHESKG